MSYIIFTLIVAAFSIFFMTVKNYIEKKIKKIDYYNFMK